MEKPPFSASGLYPMKLNFYGSGRVAFQGRGFAGGQESAELRLPADAAELRAAANQARRGHSLAGAEMLLEMRAQLSTAVPWAPMVGGPSSSASPSQLATDWWKH